MQLDNEDIAEFDSANAYKRDSAKAGSSAIDAAEDRGWLAELARLQGRTTIGLLWDIQQIFDSTDIPTLISEAMILLYPLKQLALSLTVHTAPRRLRLGQANGTIITCIGRSILAGCKRTLSLARTYTIRMVKDLCESHKEVELFQHVDDISNLITADIPNQASNTAKDYVIDFKSHTDRLKLTISQKKQNYSIR